MHELRINKKTQNSFNTDNYQNDNVKSKSKSSFNKKINKVIQVGKNKLSDILNQRNKVKVNSESVEVINCNKYFDNANYSKETESINFDKSKENESVLAILVRPELPSLIDAVINPDVLEENFYRYLEENKIKKEDLAIIQLEINKVKKQVSSEEITTRIYNLLEEMFDEKQVAMKINTIIEKLHQPLMIESEIQSNTSIKNSINVLPVILKQNESKDSFFELSELVSKISREKDIPEELLNEFKNKFIELKSNKDLAESKLKLDNILEQAHLIVSKQIFDKIKEKLKGHIQVEFEEDKQESIFEGIKVKPLSRIMVTFNMIRYILFNSLNRLKNKLVKLREFF
ncbi:TPA: hypothetical protein ACPFI9_003663 [Providencia rettgeri]